MLTVNAAVRFTDKRCEPDTGLHPFFVNAIHDSFQSVRKFGLIHIHPVSDKGLEAVVDLEKIKLIPVRILQFFQDLRFINILIIPVPGCVPADFRRFTFAEQ